MIQNNVAEGIHLVRHANVNCYIVQQDERFMIVDAAFPDVGTCSSMRSVSLGWRRNVPRHRC